MKELGALFSPRGCPPSPFAFSVVHGALVSMALSEEDVTVVSHFCLERRCSLQPSEGAVLLGAPEYGWVY